jgi:5,10-methylenetetrahydrofolate reductase
MFADVVSSFNDERKNTKLIFGIFPITKYKMATFLDTKVPGLHIPKQWIEKLEKVKGNSEEEYKIGFDLSYEIMKNTYDLNPRIHLMSANDFEVAQKLLSLVRK